MRVKESKRDLLIDSGLDSKRSGTPKVYRWIRLHTFAYDAILALEECPSG
jgi:hypothetical protein